MGVRAGLQGVWLPNGQHAARVGVKQRVGREQGDGVGLQNTVGALNFPRPPVRLCGRSCAPRLPLGRAAMQESSGSAASRHKDRGRRPAAGQRSRWDHRTPCEFGRQEHGVGLPRSRPPKLVPRHRWILAQRLELALLAIGACMVANDAPARGAPARDPQPEALGQDRRSPAMRVRPAPLNSRPRSWNVANRLPSWMMCTMAVSYAQTHGRPGDLGGRASQHPRAVA